MYTAPRVSGLSSALQLPNLKLKIFEVIILTYYITLVYSWLAMAVSSRVVAILGAGPNVGNKVAERFTAAGYKVAVLSRSGKSIPTTIAALSLSADFKNPKIVHGIFEEVRKKLGEPSVVVYNGMRIAESVHPFFKK